MENKASSQDLPEIAKLKYIKPELHFVSIDNEISLIMQSGGATPIDPPPQDDPPPGGGIWG